VGLFLSVFVLFLGAAATPAEIQEATRHVLDPGKYQTRLPGHTQPGEESEALARALRGMNRLSVSPLAYLAQWLLWGLAILAVVVFLGVLAREAWRVPGTGAEADGQHEARGSPAELGVPLADAEALAAAGQYAEAIHVLLLRTLEALARRADTALAPAWTSREILGRLPLAETPRGALSDLVSEAERCHFGGAEPSAADFVRCRERFHTFALAYGSR